MFNRGAWIRIPLAYAFVDQYGLDAVWWSFPVGFVISVVGFILLLLLLKMEVDEYGRWPQKYDASKG